MNTTGVRGLVRAPARLRAVRGATQTAASRRSGRRRSGRRRSPPERCGGIRGPRPLRRLARPSLSLSRGRPTAPCTQDPLCLSLRGREPVPGDCAHGPLRGREPAPGGWAQHGPVRGREPTPGGCEPHGPLRLSPHRGEQEGSCGARSLRFPHRLTNPRSERERRPPILQATLQESKNTGQTKQTRADNPRATPGAKPVPERVPSEGRWVRRFSSLSWPVKKGGSPRPRPEGRLDGMRLRAPQCRPRLNVSVPT